MTCTRSKIADGRLSMDVIHWRKIPSLTLVKERISIRVQFGFNVWNIITFIREPRELSMGLTCESTS